MRLGHIGRGVFVAIILGCGVKAVRAGAPAPQPGDDAELAKLAEEPIPALDANLYQDLTLPRFTLVRVKQKTEVWCWAACAQMVHRYHGQNVDQAVIAQRIMGRDGGDPANAREAQFAEVLGALDPDLYREVQKKEILSPEWFADVVKKRGVKIDLNLQQLIQMAQKPDLKYDENELAMQLRGQEPVIAGIHFQDLEGGHIVVIHGADISGDEKSGYKVGKVVLTNPTTGMDEEMGGAELGRRTDFMASKAEAQAYLKWLMAMEELVSPGSTPMGRQQAQQQRGKQKAATVSGSKNIFNLHF